LGCAGYMNSMAGSFNPLRFGARASPGAAVSPCLIDNEFQSPSLRGTRVTNSALLRNDGE